MNIWMISILFASGVKPPMIHLLTHSLAPSLSPFSGSFWADGHSSLLQRANLTYSNGSFLNYNTLLWSWTHSLSHSQIKSVFFLWYGIPFIPFGKNIWLIFILLSKKNNNGNNQFPPFSFLAHNPYSAMKAYIGLLEGGGGIPPLKYLSNPLST